MFLCGNSFAGGALACALTPTGMKNINYVELRNGIYDGLYLTKATDSALNGEFPAEWDFDTILWAKFNGSTNAGNVDWNLENTSHIILKSRTEGHFRWKTIAVREVNDTADFVINHPDYFVASGQSVEYAIVPVLSGLEGTYATTKVTSGFTKMFLVEGNVVWGTEITDGYCDTTRNIPSSTVELLNSRYPVFIRNTIADYDTGSCQGSFLPIVEENDCELAYSEEYDYQRITYQRKFMDFISDGIPKILKLPDGRLWLIQVTPNPSDTAGQAY
ncbi:MAG: hypothetical protein K2O97_12510, partial [Acetatifactor sp.]|nr:hypothetical protein [Acetatifactor sp.]